jgi:hypothetical protein
MKLYLRRPCLSLKYMGDHHISLMDQVHTEREGQADQADQADQVDRVDRVDQEDIQVHNHSRIQTHITKDLHKSIHIPHHSNNSNNLLMDRNHSTLSHRINKEAQPRVDHHQVAKQDILLNKTMPVPMICMRNQVAQESTWHKGHTVWPLILGFNRINHKAKEAQDQASWQVLAMIAHLVELPRMEVDRQVHMEQEQEQESLKMVDMVDMEGEFQVIRIVGRLGMELLLQDHRLEERVLCKHNIKEDILHNQQDILPLQGTLLNRLDTRDILVSSLPLVKVS